MKTRPFISLTSIGMGVESLRCTGGTVEAIENAPKLKSRITVAFEADCLPATAAIVLAMIETAVVEFFDEDEDEPDDDQEDANAAE